MAITKSQGYDADITSTDWKQIHPSIGLSRYGVAGLNDWKVTTAPGTRMIQIAPGWAWGHGVRDYNDAPILLSIAAAPSGSVWHMICVHRESGATTIKDIDAGSVKTLPARDYSDSGGKDDQPLALVRVTTGTTIAEIIDLRVIAWDTGLWGFDDLVLQYMNKVSTEINLPSGRWVRTVSTGGSAQWERPDQIADTGLKSTAAGVFVPKTGWKLVGTRFRARKRDGLLSIYLEFQRTGGNLDPDSNGNLPNADVGTLSTDWRATHIQLLHSGIAGRVATGYTDSTGVVTLAAVGGDGLVRTGDMLSLGGLLMSDY